MILKGSQRAGGQDLARHLMRTDDNEHVRVHELRGFAADDLSGAFKEAEAISRATKCRQYLFSLSLSPPADARVTVPEFEAAITEVEDGLGLQGQPRAVVFHEKEGRRHAHCVWSRIDAATMTARPLSFFKTKLTGLSRDLYLRHGWDMPRGIKEAGKRDPASFTLAEWQQAKRRGEDPRWLKAEVQDCWKRADSPAAFAQALKERGLFLARGDRRAHVVLDHAGEVHALARTLSLKTKEVRARLGAGDDLPGVADTRKAIGTVMTPAIRRHVQESRERFQTRSASLGERKEAMGRAHRDARETLDERLERERQEAARARAALLPRGVTGVWHRITGKYQLVRAEAESQARDLAARQETDRQALIDRQRDERAPLQAAFRELRRNQAEQLLTLRGEIGRFLKLSRGMEPGPAREVERDHADDRDAGAGRERGQGAGAGVGADTGRGAGLGLKLTR